jgi:2-dehydro-3-deoxygluconokinase
MDQTRPEMVSLGESLLRYTPRSFARFEQVQEVEIRVAGAASNVAIACARLGLQASWISKLTRNLLGLFLVRRIAQHGVNTSNVIWTDEHRVGTYYIEFGSPPRPTRIVYDRAHSAFSHIRVDEVNWDAIRSADLFHITGITPALSESCEKVAVKAMQQARTGGALVSFDVNYRSKLWSPQAAREKLTTCFRLADITFLSKAEADLVFGQRGSDEVVLKALFHEFGSDVIVLKLGEQGAVALCEGEIYRIGVYPTETIDPIGTGDAFAAGFIYGYLTSGIQKALDCGAALAALKRTFPGDVAAVSLAEVEELIGGGYTGVQR